MQTDKRKQQWVTPPEWMRAAGFVFVAATVLPVLAGIHVGTRFDHAVLGGLIGAMIGFALGVWLGLRPAWKDAGRKDRETDDK